MNFFNFLDSKTEKNDELWLDRLIDWANKNDLPHLKVEAHLMIADGYHFGFPRNKEKLLTIDTLNLKDCKLSELPKEIGKLKNLRKLWLDGNSLKKLPDEICDLTLLEELYVPNNNIDVLPENLGSLNNLIEINFKNNNIKTLPLSLVLLKKLVKIDFRSQKHGEKIASADLASSILQGNFDNDDEFRKQVGCSNEKEWQTLKEDFRNIRFRDMNVIVDGKKIAFIKIIEEMYGANIAINQGSWFYGTAKF